MTIHNERDSRSPDQTLFEKRPDTSQKRPGSRIPVGVYLGIALVVIAIIGIVLFTAASNAGTGGNGQTTSGIVVLLATVPTLLG
ncbi:MAG: hypothetical protein QOE59_2255 [Actinomycetota bacterium]|nr:hypothetical protein [Actinomycetota bacterium]